MNQNNEIKEPFGYCKNCYHKHKPNSKCIFSDRRKYREDSFLYCSCNNFEVLK
jgi:hypothetical protein